MVPIIVVALIGAALLLSGKKSKSNMGATANPIQQVVQSQPEAPVPRRVSIRQQQIDEAAEVLSEEYARAEDEEFRDNVRRKAATYFADADAGSIAKV